jgi:hypothetical protein
MSVSTILVIVAVILFAIAALGGSIGIKTDRVNLVAGGLFFWALSTLV